jgi:hypothetical protein
MLVSAHSSHSAAVMVTERRREADGSLDTAQSPSQQLETVNKAFIVGSR